MAKVRVYQAAFVSGELSPEMMGRVDLETYTKAAAKIRNCYVTPQGGAHRREGQQYIDALTGGQRGRLISFEFNTEQVYLLVFTPGEMKVYRNDVLQATVSSSPISAITATMLAEMKWTQSADTLLITHRERCIKITRSSHTVWTAADLSFSNIPQFDFGSGNEPVISNTRGWPSAIAFKYGRLWLRPYARPQTLIGSKVGDFFNLSTGEGADDDAINVTIDDDRVNAILNLFPGRALQILTSGGTFTIRGQLGDPVTPGKIAEQLQKETQDPCSPARPVSVDGATIFVEAPEDENGDVGYIVRQFTYNELEQSYKAADLSLLSTHLIRNPFTLDVRRPTRTLRGSYVYFVNADDGTMGVLNTLRDEKLLAWSLFETDGEYEDITVVGNTAYVIVKRTVNGSTVRYIEKLNSGYKMDAAKIDSIGTFSSNWSDVSTGTGTTAVSGEGVLSLSGGSAGVGWAEQELTRQKAVETYVYLDVSGGSVDYVVGSTSGDDDIASGTLPAGEQQLIEFKPTAPGSVFIGFKNAADNTCELRNFEIGITEWHGFDHLNGVEAKVQGDGYVLEDCLVSDGIITSSEPVASLEAGFDFRARVKTLPAVVELGGQLTIGERCRLVSAQVNMYNSSRFILIANGKTRRPAFRRFGSSLLDRAMGFLNGWFEVFLGGINREQQVEITQEQPLDFNLLAVKVTLEV